MVYGLLTDIIITGQRFHALAAVDDYPRKCPVIEVDASLVRTRVVSVLNRLAETRRWPRAITINNGPEFAGRCLDKWAYCNSMKLNLIRPGKPLENASAKSFIDRLRDLAKPS